MKLSSDGQKKTLILIMTQTSQESLETPSKTLFSLYFVTTIKLKGSKVYQQY